MAVDKRGRNSQQHDGQVPFQVEKHIAIHSAGANSNFIASQMGHANAQMVYQVYGSWMEENNSEQVAMLNQKLSDFAPHMPHSKAG